MNSLEKLDLNNNLIVDIPDDFFSFEKLKVLNLNDNKIKTLP